MTLNVLLARSGRNSPHSNLPSLPVTAFACALALVAAAPVRAQAPLHPSSSTPAATPDLPDAPGIPAQQPDLPSGSITGIVKDISGALIPGAQITLIGSAPAASPPRVLLSGQDGSFTFAGLPPGLFHIAISAPGLSAWSWSGTLPAGQSLSLPQIALQLPTAVADVEVNATRTEVAAAELQLEEKQRVLGIFPNFYAVYLWNAAPLTSRQKFHLAWRSSIDPVTVGVTGLVAGIQQSDDDFKGYGQGTAGYSKRFAANYADGVISTVIGGAILPSLFHQDPRYFVKGTGSIRSRALYAIATTVICRGDNRRWQPNYSNVLGNIATAAISNAYYPASDRNGASLTVENSLVGTASGAIGSLIQEFLLRKITPHVPNYSPGDRGKPAQPNPTPSNPAQPALTPAQAP